MRVTEAEFTIYLKDFDAIDEDDAYEILGDYQEKVYDLIGMDKIGSSRGLSSSNMTLIED